MDRIQHSGLEDFKTRVLRAEIEGRTVSEWAGLLGHYEKVAERLESLEIKRKRGGVREATKGKLAQRTGEFERALSALVARST